MTDYTNEAKEDLIIAIEMYQVTVKLLSRQLEQATEEIKKLKSLVCECKIEMATFREKGSTCPHCQKLITTSSNL